MKSSKFLSLLAIGFVTVIFFSFKSEEPVKEYCSLECELNSLIKPFIVFPDRIQYLDKIPSSTNIAERKEILMKYVNDLAKDGWKPVLINGNSIYLERNKN